MHEEKLRTMSMSQKDEKESLERNLTEEEVAVYDRQIRLWGVESQKRYILIEIYLFLSFLFAQRERCIND